MFQVPLELPLVHLVLVRGPARNQGKAVEVRWARSVGGEGGSRQVYLGLKIYLRKRVFLFLRVGWRK